MMRVQAKQNWELYFFRKSEAKNASYQPWSFEKDLDVLSIPFENVPRHYQMGLPYVLLGKNKDADQSANPHMSFLFRLFNCCRDILQVK